MDYPAELVVLARRSTLKIVQSLHGKIGPANEEQPVATPTQQTVVNSFNRSFLKNGHSPQRHDEPAKTKAMGFTGPDNAIDPQNQLLGPARRTQATTQTTQASGSMLSGEGPVQKRWFALCIYIWTSDI